MFRKLGKQMCMVVFASIIVDMIFLWRWEGGRGYVASSTAVLRLQYHSYHQHRHRLTLATITWPNQETTLSVHIIPSFHQ